MRNTWNMIMDWRYNPLVPHTGHEHTAHGDAGAGMDVVHHLQHVGRQRRCLWHQCRCPCPVDCWHLHHGRCV